MTDVQTTPTRWARMGRYAPGVARLRAYDRAWLRA